LFGEYRELRGDLDDQLDQVVLQLPSISGSLWAFDDRQIDLALQALVRMPHVARARVTTADREKQWSAGEAQSNNVVVRAYSLRREVRGQDSELGTLEVVASLDGIVGRVVDHAVSIVLGNGVKTLLVVIFMVVVIRRLVTSRLEDLARNVGELVPSSLSHGGPGDSTRGAAPGHLDELGAVQWALEDAASRLGVSVEALRCLNDELEERIHQRTLELEEANRELQAFGYTLSHDLRAPLRGIAGFTRILEEDYAERLDAPARAHLARILHSTERMDALIDDTIGLFRLSGIQPHIERVALGEMAMEIAEELGQCEPARKVRWSIDRAVRVEADPGLLRTVMENLLGNAWKYSAKREDAAIDVGEMRDEAGAQICFVRDNGAGFDMQYAGQLFMPFQRLHRPDEFPGTGVGLATVKKIIDRHGGRVWAESMRGEGTTIYFQLPVSTAENTT
jgi:signal transduction histidine kinase